MHNVSQGGEGGLGEGRGGRAGGGMGGGGEGGEAGHRSWDWELEIVVFCLVFLNRKQKNLPVISCECMYMFISFTE